MGAGDPKKIWLHRRNSQVFNLCVLHIRSQDHKFIESQYVIYRRDSWKLHGLAFIGNGTWGGLCKIMSGWHGPDWNFQMGFSRAFATVSLSCLRVQRLFFWHGNHHFMYNNDCTFNKYYHPSITCPTVTERLFPISRSLRSRLCFTCPPSHFVLLVIFFFLRCAIFKRLWHTQPSSLL